jgi:hypothetical protein
MLGKIRFLAAMLLVLLLGKATVGFKPAQSYAVGTAPRMAGGWPTFAPPRTRHHRASTPRFSVTYNASNFVLFTCVPDRLHRFYRAGYLHFITTSCHHRSALLGSR